MQESSCNVSVINSRLNIQLISCPLSLPLAARDSWPTLPSAARPPPRVTHQIPHVSVRPVPSRSLDDLRALELESSRRNGEHQGLPKAGSGPSRIQQSEGCVGCATARVGTNRVDGHLSLCGSSCEQARTVGLRSLGHRSDMASARPLQRGHSRARGASSLGGRAR